MGLILPLVTRFVQNYIQIDCLRKAKINGKQFCLARNTINLPSRRISLLAFSFHLSPYSLVNILLAFDETSSIHNQYRLSQRIISNMNENDEGGGSGASDTSVTPTAENPTLSTTIIPFDGQGRDPAALVGREVEHYHQKDGSIHLESRCTNGRLQIHKVGPCLENEDYEVSIDENLGEALKDLRSGQVKTLKVLEAVTAERQSFMIATWDYQFSNRSHRVIGLRMEGMQSLGYISCKIQRVGKDEHDLEGAVLFFYDVVLASDSVTVGEKDL